jgi:hypothetical protein
MKENVIPYLNIKWALKHGWCSVTQVLEYLQHIKTSTASLIIYNDVCNHASDGQHYLSTGVHFLCKPPSFSYRALYLMKKLPMDASTHRTQETALLIRSLFNLSLDATEKQRMEWIEGKISENDHTQLQTIMGVLPNTTLSYGVLATYMKGNNTPPTSFIDALFQNETMANCLFDRDLFGVMDLMIHLEPGNKWLKTWYDQIIRRLNALALMDEQYFTMIKPYYKATFLKLLDLFMPDYEDIKTFRMFFDGSVPELEKCGASTRLSELILRLPSMEEQAYVLGIPLNMFRLTPPLILNRLKDLEELGINEYCNQQQRRFRQSVEAMFPGLPIEDSDLVTGESLFGYNSFDVLPYAVPDRVYLYVRDEAEEIREKKKDRFNQSVSVPFFSTLQDRQKQAITYDLGRAQPLQYNLERLLNGLLKDPAVNFKADKADEYNLVAMADMTEGVPGINVQTFGSPHSTAIFNQLIANMMRDVRTGQ